MNWLSLSIELKLSFVYFVHDAWHIRSLNLHTRILLSSHSLCVIVIFSYFPAVYLSQPAFFFVSISKQKIYNDKHYQIEICIVSWLCCCLIIFVRQLFGSVFAHFYCFVYRLKSILINIWRRNRANLPAYAPEMRNVNYF